MNSEELKQRDSPAVIGKAAIVRAEEAPLLIEANIALVNAKDEAERAELVRWFRSGVDLAKALVWPSLIFYVFFTLRAPLQQILAQVPIELSQAQ